MGVVTVAALSLASLGVSLSVRLQAEGVVAGGVVRDVSGTGRGFISEEEPGTADLLRLGRALHVFSGASGCFT